MQSWIGALFPFEAAIRNPTANSVITAVWIGFTILFAIVAAAWFWIGGWRPCRNRLKEIKGLLSAVSPGDVRQFELLRDRMRRSPWFGHLWTEFDETLIRFQSEDGRTQIFSTVDAGHFFSEESLIAPHLNLRFYNAMPGYLTGLGILGTFFGITIGLGSINLATSDIEVLKQGIKGLLEGAYLAFATSVWGMSLSIPFSIYEKHFIKLLHKEVSALQQMIDAAFLKRPPEYWLAHGLNEAREQTSQLKKFNTDLALSIAAALDETMAARLTPTLEQLLKTVGELKEFKAESSIEAIRQLSYEFERSLSNQSNATADRIRNLLDDASQTLEGNIKKSQEGQEQMQLAMTQQMNQLSNVASGIISEVSSHQQAAIDRARESTGQLLERMEGLYSNQQQKIQETTNGAFSTIQDAVLKASDQLSKLVSDVAETSSQTSARMSSNITELSDASRQLMSEVSARYHEERHAISALLAQVQTALAKAEDSFQGIALAGEALGKANEPIKSAAEELRTAVHDFSHAQENFAGLVTEAQTAGQEQLSVARQVGQELLQSLEITRDSWKAYQGNFARLRDDLNSVFRELGEGLGEYRTITQESLTQYLKGLDGHLAEAVGTLGGAIENLQDVVEDLKSANGRAK